MRLILFFLSNMLFFFSFGQTVLYNSEFKKDTFDINNYRIYIDVPELSIKHSNYYVVYAHGEGICYPLMAEGNRGKFIIIESVADTSYDMFDSKDFDYELWNTFNKDWFGSRCYINNGRYYRIDKLPGNIIIIYEDLSKEAAKTADKIIKSIHIESKTKSSIPIQDNKRVHKIFK